VSASPPPPLDLNTATLEELLQLPGVDEVLAQRLIAARPFRSVDDLRTVEGLGPELLALLASRVTVEAPAPVRPAGYYGAGPSAPAQPKPLYTSRWNSLPVKTRWLILQAAVYGALALLIGIPAVYLYVSYASGFLATPMATATSTPARADVVAATATAAPSATAAPTSTASPRPSATPPPSATDAPPSPTPEPTATLPPSLTPSPTRTPLPLRTGSPTPPPTATLPALTPPPGGAALRFLETFDTPSRYLWLLRVLDPIRTEIKDGALVMQVRRTSIGYTFGSMAPVEDVYYQAAARAEACAGSDHYGLVLRASDEANFYLFGVTCDGRARAQSLEDGRYRLMAESGTEASIRTGAGVVNVLAVRAVNNTFQFIVNGATALILTDSSQAAGQFGVYARSLTTPTLIVAFDDLTGWNAAP
jgi:hypothetical protein